MSLLECVMVIGVISILTMIVVPAVQSSREAGRRLHCMNNLKQIGLALGSYESKHGYFPAICGRTSWPGTRWIAGHCYSPFPRMLAELDHTPLYNGVNFTYPPDQARAVVANATVMLTSLGVLLCPSSPAAPVAGYGRTDYHFNYGKSPWAVYTPSGTNPDYWTGPFSVDRFYRTSDIADGLSNTIAVSERLQGDWMAGVFRRAGDYRLANITSFPALTVSAGVAACRSLSADAPHESRGGESWFLSGFHFTGYNHATTPNSTVADCAFDPSRGGLHSRFMRDGVFAARSMHPGCVHSLSLDGGVRFVRDGIEPEVWQALATKSGGDFSGL